MSEQWSHPPVFYALAQVQFNAIAAQKFADDVQQAFRTAGFPDAIREDTVVLGVTAAAEPSEAPSVRQNIAMRHSYMDAGRTEGFVWQANSLVYHTTNYQTFEHFRDRFLLGLATLSMVTTPDFVTRVGARYLDLVRPEQGESLNRYLVTEVLGLSGKFEREGHTMSETVVSRPPQSLISRVFITNLASPQPHPPMPNELLPLHLAMKSTFQQIEGRIAVLDTDCFETIEREPFDTDRIGQRLWQVKSQIQGAFDALITNEARRDWQ